jgi:hypothetical protein
VGNQWNGGGYLRADRNQRANTHGLHPTELTVFTNEILFNGVDSNGEGEYGLFGEYRKWCSG